MKTIKIKSFPLVSELFNIHYSMNEIEIEKLKILIKKLEFDFKGKNKEVARMNLIDKKAELAVFEDEQKELFRAAKIIENNLIDSEIMPIKKEQINQRSFVGFNEDFD